MPRFVFPQIIPEFLVFRQSLVDKVLSFDSDRKEIEVQKNISFSDITFQGHFPDQPIFPGVLQIECAAQATGILVKLLEKDVKINSLPILTSIESAKFKMSIYPGDVIKISVFNLKEIGRFFLAECEIKKDNQICSRIKLSCTNKQ
ncbi:beta-hydroxyacyl-ACP dehydratase [Lactiplantibacillus pentosus]|uniref:3-hydroxyacyl-ACP dehydratase FabZ family protein n=1 Tax=Lactiplantibacillus pentosus TaxID=1589 RepID=UPI000EAA6526|nr:3-hydroxyacyl-ACP dehydratase FabZ family protein [Lactiplantibacillus pentosus]AYG37344.1 beta-hydroxyacyl-ACP dehydratase [Lactiplantibacillus pentosus]AYG40000.1 beta-hydroxyacyl-ACP dehydratase [Lactiplantibacillus pentosus]